MAKVEKDGTGIDKAEEARKAHKAYRMGGNVQRPRIKPRASVSDKATKAANAQSKKMKAQKKKAAEKS